MNIPDEALRAADAAYTETLVRLRLAEGGGFKVASQQKRALASALEAAAPHLLAEAFDAGQKSGMRHADRLVAAAKIGRPELPGPLSPNPYRK